MKKIWAIVLAAGVSTRMKRQKLLLPFNRKTIIGTIVENVVQSVNTNVIVVLGSHREKIHEQLVNYDVKLCVNENFKNGMLSVVFCGFSALPKRLKQY